jgi:hypothetical protein
MISERIACSAQMGHLSCVEISTISRDRNELPIDPRHQGVPSVVPKMISKAFSRSAQTVHLSCMLINIISKQTKMSFQLTHVTKDVHRVRPKRFPCPWYIWHKPCTYLVPRSTPSPSRPKQAST